MLDRLFKRKRHGEAAEALYARIVAQGRRPAFYASLGVPDTLDGRFDLITLHAFLVLRRLKGERGETAALAQCLFDTLFGDMDSSLRELGAGDLGVAPRVKAMVRAFYGRIVAYEEAMARGDALDQALRRNLYGTTEPKAAQVAAMAAYLRREAEALVGQATGALLAGRVDFGEPPALDGGG